MSNHNTLRKKLNMIILPLPIIIGLFLAGEHLGTPLETSENGMNVLQASDEENLQNQNPSTDEILTPVKECYIPIVYSTEDVTCETVPEQTEAETYPAHPESSSTVIEGNGMFEWPVNGGQISDHFGGERGHKGLDISAPTGTEVYASADGKVIRAGWNSGGYGNYVIIEHPDGYQTLYAHGSEVVAVEGQKVRKGQLILLVGSTGDSTGSHCHFEVRIDDVCVNPEDYLRVNAD